MDILNKVLKRNSVQLLDLPNVVGVGKGWKMTRGESSKDLSVVVLVNKKVPSHNLTRSETVPKNLGTFATDVVEVGDLRFLSRTELHRPAPPGVSIGHYSISAGTFGAVVRDRKTQELMILSNNHVLANSTDGYDGRSRIGDPVLQPGPHDGGKNEDLIGHLHRFVPLSREFSAPNCSQAASLEKIGNRCIRVFRPNYRMVLQKLSPQGNLVDAAVARPLKPELITSEIMGIGKVKGIKEVEIGMKLQKSGRSSGLNSAPVRVISTLLKVALSAHESVLFDDQIVTGPMASPGDSGSLVLTEDNHAVGLLFAGSDSASVVNRINHVMDLLDVDLLIN